MRPLQTLLVLPCLLAVLALPPPAQALEQSAVERYAQKIAKQVRLGSWKSFKRQFFIVGGGVDLDTTMKPFFDDMENRNVKHAVLNIEDLPQPELDFVNLLPPAERAKVTHAIKLSYEDKREQSSAELRLPVYDDNGKPKLLLVALDPEAQPDAAVDAAPANETIEAFAQRFAGYVEAGDWPNIRNNFHLEGGEGAIVQRRAVYKSCEGKPTNAALGELYDVLSMDRKTMRNAPVEIFDNTRRSLRLTCADDSGGANFAVPLTQVEGQYKVLIVADDYIDPADEPFISFGNTIAGHIRAGRWQRLEPLVHTVGDRAAALEPVQAKFTKMKGTTTTVSATAIRKLEDRDKQYFGLNSLPDAVAARTTYIIAIEPERSSSQRGAYFPVYNDNGTLKLLVVERK